MFPSMNITIDKLIKADICILALSKLLSQKKTSFLNTHYLCKYK